MSKHVGEGIVPQIKDVTGQIKLINLIKLEGLEGLEGLDLFILEMPLNGVRGVNG